MTPIEARLNEAMRVFQIEVAELLKSGSNENFLGAASVFRNEVEEAAAAGIEHWFVWQMAAQWAIQSDDRIHCYSRALTAMDNLPPNARHPSESFFRADFLTNIGDAHRKRRNKVLARKFYEQALPFARASADQHGNAVTAGSGPCSLEGRIAAALLLVDEAE